MKKLRRSEERRFVDIILRNSNTTNLQDNVFLAELFTAVANVETNTFEIEVYPNPASGDFFINVAASQSGEGILQVTDLLGHLIEEKRSNLSEGMNTLQFNLKSHLPDGLYNVTLTMDRKIGHQKIFKNSR